jgi:hypothetical protein
MPTFCNTRVSADPYGGMSVRSATGADARRRRRGPKGQRKAAVARRVTVPMDGDLVTGRSCAVLRSARSTRGASHDRWLARPGALRAPLKP